MTLLLTGVQPEPLASYLTALGVLRILHEQVDPDVKGSWTPRGFALETSLDRAGLIAFMTERWCPSPICSPWNGSSGFYEGDIMEGRDRIMGSTDPRLSAYRDVIARIAAWEELPVVGSTPIGWLDQAKVTVNQLQGKLAEALQEAIDKCTQRVNRCQEAVPTMDLSSGTLDSLLTWANSLDRAMRAPVKDLQAELKKLRSRLNDLARKGRKVSIMRRFRNELPEVALPWLDAAVGIRDQEFAVLPLLGSGGNEGRLDYSNTFMRHASALVVELPRADALAHALFGDGAPTLTKLKTGQFDPGGAGGFNQGFGIKQEDQFNNPWSFVLTLEGALLWSGSIARRHHTDSQKMVVSPFTVRASAQGYGSASVTDEEGARAELWMPLWSRPTGLRELRAFLAEGRADVSTKSGAKPARTGLDFARAAATLGVSRGVYAFSRYSLLKRRGDSYVALPAGRFHVVHRSAADLLGELDRPLQDVDVLMRRFPGDPPAGLLRARRSVDGALFRVAERGDKRDVLALLRAIGQLERFFANRGPARTPALRRPLAGLTEAWIDAASDVLELRLALSLVSVGHPGDAGPLRANLAHIDPLRPMNWATGSGRERSWRGATTCERLATVLSRRCLKRDHRSSAGPLRGARPVGVQDALALATGAVDDRLLEDLLFALTWMKLERVRPLTPRRSRDTDLIPPSFACLALLFTDTPLSEIAVRPEPRILPLLLGGREREACTIALRRLRVSGLALRIPEDAIRGDGLNPARLAAALLVPLTRPAIRTLEARILRQPKSTPPPATNEESHAV
jgi:CRISPR-associated protein Csx17